MIHHDVGRAICAFSLVALAAACSSGGGSTTLVTQTGRTIKYVPCDTTPQPVAGATVTVGSRSVTTAKDGTYSIEVPAGVPFTMSVTKAGTPSFVPLTEAENVVEASYARGDTRLIPTDTATLLSGALPSFDSTRALLTIELVKTGSCTDLGGTTVKVSPANSDALTQYPAQCISPVGPNAFASDGVFPAAVVYNLTPGSRTVTATSPKCTQIPYPYTDPKTGLTYDGNVATQGGMDASFIRVFMK